MAIHVSTCALLCATLRDVSRSPDCATTVTRDCLGHNVSSHAASVAALRHALDITEAALRALLVTMVTHATRHAPSIVDLHRVIRIPGCAMEDATRGSTHPHVLRRVQSFAVMDAMPTMGRVHVAVRKVKVVTGRSVVSCVWGVLATDVMKKADVWMV